MELDGMDYQGLITTYAASGYVALLGKTKNEAIAVLDRLFNGTWIDRGTRAIMVDFTLYNPNLNLFAAVK